MSASASCNAQRTSIDFLEAQFEGAGVRRSGGVFSVVEPWAIARFGRIHLSSGWWKLECEGGEHATGAEVRLSTFEQPLIIFRARQGGDAPQARAVYFGKGAAADVSVLASAWPRDVEFAHFRLRKVTAIELLQLFSAAASRLMRRRNPLSRAWYVLARLMNGAPLDFGGGGAHAAVTKLSLETAGPNAIPFKGVVRRIDDLVFQLHAEDKLHPDAAKIAKATFAGSPETIAIYADVMEGGSLIPIPTWDPVLAQHYDFSDRPLVVRQSYFDAVPRKWLTLAEVVAHAGQASIRRCCLPLASRPTLASSQSPKVDVPVLSKGPRVSVIIPTKYRIDLLARCLHGLRNNTDYPNIQVVIVDNGSTDPELSRVVAQASESFDITHLRDEDGFNFSRLINLGAQRADGEVILLLNDDIEPIESGWLHRLVASCLDPEVGAVGARLLYPDGSIQHAGVVLGVGGVAGHLWRGADEQVVRRIPQIALPGERLAVTGACLAVRRDAFDRVAGLDEALAVALNDIDFCLRLNDAGYRTIYRGDAVLIHHESQSRGSDDASLEKRARLSREHEIFLSRWRTRVQDDPFGSRALDFRTEIGQTNPVVLDD